MQNRIQHAVDWFEIPCVEIDRAQTFYQTILNTRLHRENCSGPGMTMAVFPACGDDAVRGALQSGPGVAPPSLHGTLIYLNAGASVDAALARVNAAGGHIQMPRTALPDDLGFIAHIIDSEGNRVGLHSKDA
jgi:uncharacterized protein